MKKKTKRSLLPIKSESTPATAGMIYELKEYMDKRFSKIDRKFSSSDGRFEQIDGHFKQIDGRFEQIDGHFEQTDGQFKQIDGRFDQVDGRFDELENNRKADHDILRAEIHRIALLVEEQNARNKYVMDGYAQMYDFIEKKFHLES